MLEKYRHYFKVRLAASLTLLLLSAAVFSSQHQFEHISDSQSHNCEICLFSSALDKVLENNELHFLFASVQNSYNLLTKNSYNSLFHKYTQARAPPLFI